MAADVVVDAFLAAGRKQRLLTIGQRRSLRPRLAAAGLRNPQDLRRWLAASSGLPADLLPALVELLPPPDGRTFAPYTALAHLASGGMGAIWLACAPSGALVVIKTLAGPLRSAAGAVARDADGELWIDEARASSDSPGGDPAQRLERETRITRSLDHPHIVRCLDHGLASDGQAFLVLEFMADGDLKDLLEDHGPLEEPLVLSLARQVAAALEVAHRQELLHRDVKPGNVFLSADGHAKLADFGFARSNRQNRTLLTMAGSVLGSPLYMAPEQVTADARIDIRCDLYGLGCVLFHCLTGAPPYTGSMHQVLRAHCTAAVPDVRRGRPEISHATAALVARLLHKEPAGRFRDPTELKFALIEAMAGVHLRPDQLVPLPARDGASSARLQAATTVDLPPPPGGAVAAPAPAPEPANAIDLSGALETEWLTLVEAASGTQVCCWARPRLVLGKLRGPGVDLCLRNYPEEEHREACTRISRTHLALGIDQGLARIEDLGSANGSSFDGQPLPARQPVALVAGRDHLVEIARTVSLRIRAIARRDSAEGDPAFAPSDIDAVVCTRQDNRPGLGYALVPRRVSLGGGDADIPLPGARGRIEIGRLDGRWVRRSQDGAWGSLAAGARMDLDGVQLVARAGSPDDL